MQTSRTAKIVFVFSTFVIGSFLAALVLRQANGGVPETFANARLQGALIAQNIVNISNDSARDLERISAFDREQNYTDALALAVETIAKSKDIRDGAVQLSFELEKMTRTLSDIGSPQAREAALEAISSRLALLSRLINYSAYLGELLDNLRERFTGKAPPKSIALLVEQVNTEVIAINSLNTKASEAMQRFDEILKK